MQKQRNQDAAQTATTVQERVDNLKLCMHYGKLYQRIAILLVVVPFPIVEMIL